MKPIGTIAQPILKLMKIFSTKRNIPFSTSQPFKTEIGLKAGQRNSLGGKTKKKNSAGFRIPKVWSIFEALW